MGPVSFAHAFWMYKNCSTVGSFPGTSGEIAGKQSKTQINSACVRAMVSQAGAKTTRRRRTERGEEGIASKSGESRTQVYIRVTGSYSAG